MAGLTEKGLEIKTLSDVISDYNTQAQAIYADLVAPGDIVDVSGNTALGRIIGVVSPALADVWQAIQQVNDSFNPNTAVGYALDNIIAISGISRLAATPTRAQVILEGSVNTSISSPLGKVYSSITQRSFSIVSPVVLTPKGASGVGLTTVAAVAGDNYTFSYTVDGVNYIDVTVKATAPATSTSILAQLKTAVDAQLSATFSTYYKDSRLWVDRTDPFQTVTFTTSNNLRIEKVRKPGLVADDEVGPYEAKTSYIDTISVPIVGWDSVTNPIPAVTGRLEETDDELRERFRNSKFIQSQNILEALLDALRNVEGVTDVNVYENDQDEVNQFGVPGHGFMPIVLGGLPTDIGNAIWQNSPFGIESAGNTTVQIVDTQGYIHNMSFQRPVKVPVYMNLNISNTGTMPGDAIAQIRQALKDYGESNYFIGDDVVYSRFYTPINSIPGHQVNSFTIGTAPSNMSSSNIPIAFNQVAEFDVSRINITIS